MNNLVNNMHNAYTCMLPCNQKETVDNTEMHLHKIRISCSYGLQPKKNQY